ncbi:23S rRNA (uracil(1939)-C(5))-methyltransferase RlmD [Porcipelethomonas sp.]|uniref:23S rRNA (uracil(1939)-C(5))-methyltransferase RlmD n=1 Tax=Porcipelethomonas sp. TaxID=2981675 RepID=UPI003EF2F6DF
MVKNEIIILEITDITTDGNGVGKYNGMAVFVPETAVGDLIEAKVVKVLKNYSFAIVNKILKASKDRIDSDCPYFPKCGGCSFRHINYNAELKIKEKFVYDAFTRIGKINCDFLPILGCDNQNGYRNKAQYPVAEKNGKIECGFYAKRSHRIIGGFECRLIPDEFSKIAQMITKYAAQNNISAYNEMTGKGILRHIYLRRGAVTGEIMVCVVVSKPCAEKFYALCDMLKSHFKSVVSIVMNINSQNTNVILGHKTIVLYGKDKITDIMCGNIIGISSQSFYQVNSPQAEKLYKIAEEFADFKGDESLLDLYCGAGTIGLSMADKVKKLTGVEIIPQAVENARENAANSGIENAEFICSDAGEAAHKLAESESLPDVVIVDPPRKGCDKLTLDSMVKMHPEKIVMVSCNPATAARDCAYLVDNGYETVKVKAVDLFPRTCHVECVVLMSKA